MDKAKLLVRFKIPFIGDSNAGLGEFMIFHKWLPIEEKDFFNIDTDLGTLIFWFDLDNISSLSKPELEEIKKWVNITTDSINVDLITYDYDEELLGFISHPENISDKREKLLQEKSRAWGYSIQNHIIIYFNKLVSFAHSIMGQYWLHEYPNEGNYYPQFEVRAKLDDGDWFWFDPIKNISISITMPSDYGRYFDKNSWQRASDFILGDSLPGFHLFLLSNAESLFLNGNNRPALTEAVTALEIVLNNFANNANKMVLFPEEYSKRSGLPSLRKAINQFGLEKTVNYLLPLIFNEEQLPTKFLRNCQEAIQTRGNVVHNGQRKIDSKKLKEYIKSIRYLCNFLESV